MMGYQGELQSADNPRIVAQLDIAMANRFRALMVESYSSMPLCLALQARMTLVHYASLQRQSFPSQVHSLIVPSQLAVTSFDYSRAGHEDQLFRGHKELRGFAKTYVLVRQPSVVDDDLLVRMQPLQDLPSLPVPEYHVPLSVTTGYETPVWRESDCTCVSGNSVPSESLLSVLSEAVGRVDKDLVVKRLRREPFF